MFSLYGDIENVFLFFVSGMCVITIVVGLVVYDIIINMSIEVVVL